MTAAGNSVSTATKEVIQGVRDAAAFCDCSTHPDAAQWAGCCRVAAHILSVAQGSQEPVAWRYRFVTSVDGDWSDWFIVDDPQSIPKRDNQVVQALFAAPQPGGIAYSSQQPRWRHKKRGTTYVEIGRASLQIATDPVEEDDRVVIYRSDTDGRLWVRGEAEFMDGRFEAISIPSTHESAAARTPKVRTSHHRNKEEASRLQALVDTRLLCSCKASARDGQHMAWCPVVSSTDGGSHG